MWKWQLLNALQLISYAILTPYLDTKLFPVNTGLPYWAISLIGFAFTVCIIGGILSLTTLMITLRRR